YQVYCRDILLYMEEGKGLHPYQDEGIDVTITGTLGETITFDVLLEDAEGNLLAVECKREQRTEQGELIKFSASLRWLADLKGKKVAGVMFTREKFQQGCMRHAVRDDIKLIVCELGQQLSNIQVAYQRYSPELKKLIEDIRGYLTAADFGTGQDEATVT